jgi:thiol-disulfide isomerase/thioredoxin
MLTIYRVLASVFAIYVFCVLSPQEGRAGTMSPSLPVEQAMPPIDGISQWINSAPLTRESLKGKVVLLEFWTFGCINCYRTLPFMKQWHQTYKDRGVVVLGIHTPEFGYEKDFKNVSNAVRDQNIFYPVALDNDYTTWKNFNNEGWPAIYLIDAQGRIRYHHFGEGEYDRIEAGIQTLLKEKGNMSL